MDYLDTLRAAGVDPKGNAIPEFFLDTVENTFKSAQEGRPCFVDVECVKFLIPGDRNSAPVQRVDDDIRARYKVQYDAFKAGLEPALDGMPLTEWPPIKRSQVAEFAYFNIRTVEALASVNDNQIQNLPMGARELRNLARAHIDVANNGTGPLAKLVSRIDALESEGKSKDQLLDEALARIKELEKPNAGAAA